MGQSVLPDTIVPKARCVKNNRSNTDLYFIIKEVIVNHWFQQLLIHINVRDGVNTSDLFATYKNPDRI